MTLFKSKLFTLCLLLTASFSCLGRSYPYNGTDTLVGALEFAIVDENCNNLYDLAHQYDTGYDSLLDANPHLKGDSDLKPGLMVYIPNQAILPKPLKPDTILVNTAEKRLFYHHSKSNTLYIFPVGVGRLDHPTPTGKMRVTLKRFKPTWHVPAGVLAEAHSNGFMEHPTVMPHGPDNPLGKHAIHLSAQSYLIHSTHNTDLIGTRNTSGCLNLYPEDIAILYSMISVNTPVEIVNVPFKMAIKSNTLYIERHLSLFDTSDQENFADVHSILDSQIKQIKAHPQLKNTLSQDKLDNITNLLQNPVSYPVAVN